MTRLLSLPKGERAAIVSTDGDQVTLSSSVSSPPGSSLNATLEAHSLLVKVRGCRRDPKNPEGLPFTIDGRFVSLTKTQREAVLSASRHDTSD
jgi:hypothetical protein